MKALKPSEMGLHSTVRCEMRLRGGNRREQAEEIVLFAEELYAFIRDYNDDGKLPKSPLITLRFARFVSKAFNFSGYTDDEIFKFITQEIDRMRK